MTNADNITGDQAWDVTPNGRLPQWADIAPWFVPGERVLLVGQPGDAVIYATYLGIGIHPGEVIVRHDNDTGRWRIGRSGLRRLPGESHQTAPSHVEAIVSAR